MKSTCGWNATLCGTRSAPASCSVFPTSDWSSVDFPPATGPLMSTSSPGVMCRSTPAMHADGA